MKSVEISEMNNRVAVRMGRVHMDQVNIVADPNGYASLAFTDPGGVPSGTELLIQVVGTPFGSTSPFALSATSNITFP